MQDNPYHPPTAAVEDERPQTPKRPISVWLLLAVLVICALLFVFGMVYPILTGESLRRVQRSPIDFAIWTAWRLAFVAIVVFMICAVLRRWLFARWIGPFVILLMGFAILMRPDSTQYANDAERAGGAFSRKFLMPLLLVWWAYAVCFSEKAKRYFATSDPDPWD